MMAPLIDWPKLELSDPLLEWGGLRFVTVKSGHLHGRGDLLLYVPEAVARLSRVPAVILLHGVYGSAWSWALKGAVHLTAARLIAAGEIPPMVLAMPSDGLWGDGTGYLRQDRADYEAWIAADVPAVVRHVVPQTAGGAIGLSGLSMGGYAALRVGAKYGRTHFAAISAHSACTKLEDLYEFVTEAPEEFTGVQGSHAVMDLIFAQRNNVPALRFDCGTEDLLLERNRALSKSLQAIHVPHEYAEFPGGHTWEYWREHVADTLRFFAKTLPC